MQRQILVAVEEAFEAHLHSNEESNVWRSATVQLAWLKSRVFRKRCDRKAWLLSRQHCAPPIVPPWKDCWMAAMFLLSCFLKDLLRLVEHHLSFRSAMFWSSTGILLNDKAEDWNEIATSLLECCTTSRPLHISSRKCKKWSQFPWKNCYQKFEDLFSVHVVEQLSWFLAELFDLLLLTHVFKELFLLLMFSKISISCATLFCRRVSCNFTVGIDIPGIL